MLLNFKIKNFKSYKDETLFTMTKAPKLQGLDYSILKEKIGSKEYKALCSSVIYGPNASGKSNIIDALKTLRKIVLIGHIKKEYESISEKQIPLTDLDFIPFIFDKNEPTKFEIEFTHNSFHYNYTIEIFVAGPLNKKHKNEILYEKLVINDQTIFERNHNKIVVLLRHKKFEDDFVDLNITSLTEMFNETLVEHSVFLANGFKQFSKKFSQEIISWFEKKLYVFKKLGDTYSAPAIDFEEEAVYIDEFTNKIASVSGVSADEVAYVKNNKTNKPETVSIIKNENDEKIAIPVHVIESYGTTRIIQLMPIVYTALKHGAILVIDELDVALHPMVVMNIIKIFHNDEININKAQLIFNTHNPIYLNCSIFRRDEIKFVEKDPETRKSIIYALSDFGTKGQNGVRKTTDYVKNYFMNKYGAIIDIDYSEIFKDKLKDK